MPQHHNHGPHIYNRAFAIGVALNISFVVIEVVYGFIAESLALIADAGHNLGDVVGLLLAWGASVLATKRPTPRYTYGFRRATILASLFSGLLLLMAMGAIAWEALERLSAPAAVDGATVIIVAAIGVIINTATALMFFSGRKHDLNIKGAYLHMAADAAVSLGVVIAGIAIIATGWLWLDPAISLFIVAVILISTWDLLRDSMNLAVDSVPRNIDPIEVEAYLRSQPGVADIHDLHIWAMSTTETALTAHLTIPGGKSDDCFLQTLSQQLLERFSIEHTTLQIETGDGENHCRQAQPDSL